MFGIFDWLTSGLAVVQTADAKRIAFLEKKIKEARELLEEIVIPEGPDKGVLLKDPNSETYYEPKVESLVYTHQHFSQMGDALIELHEKLKMCE